MWKILFTTILGDKRKEKEIILTVLGRGFLVRLLCGIKCVLGERSKSGPELTAGGDSPLLLLTHKKKIVGDKIEITSYLK